MGTLFRTPPQSPKKTRPAPSEPAVLTEKNEALADTVQHPPRLTDLTVDSEAHKNFELARADCREPGHAAGISTPLSTVKPVAPDVASTSEPSMDRLYVTETPNSGSTQMEQLWMSRDSITCSPGAKTRAGRHCSEIVRNLENIVAQLQQNKSVTKENKKCILQAVEAIRDATMRFTGELAVLGVGQTDNSPTMDPSKLKEDIIAGVQAEMSKMRAEQKEFKKEVMEAIGYEQEVNEKANREEEETFSMVVGRKNNNNKKRHRSEAAAAAAAAASGTILDDDLTAPAVGRPYRPKVYRTSVPPPPPPPTNFVVVLESIDPRQDGKDVLKEVKEKVDVVKIGIGIKSVRETKNKKVVISCDSNEDRQKLSTAIKDKTTNITVDVPRLRNPTLRIIGVIPEFANEKIEDAITKQNVRLLEGIAEEKKKIRFVRTIKGRNDSIKNVIVDVSPEVWAAMNGQKLRIGYQSLMAVDQSPILQCFKCFGFGHRASDCKATARCAYCAENHDTRGCNNRESGPSCVNCMSNEGTADHRHYAYSTSCPQWIKWDRIARAAIRYC
ncbi:uncharacterized protein LOC133534172 [Cydia pomonella]|uniref:uncharacterized protein LOC133534172 n=1 Tax=Cydia pomonella TaxID=82600 RepID=UPI002ADDABA2|nr:uncharacterized protein LOC133534172 [Cydia pomonella]